MHHIQRNPWPQEIVGASGDQGREICTKTFTAAQLELVQSSSSYLFDITSQESF